MSKRRVVVTGLGLVTPLGLDVKETWANLLAGKSGIAPIEVFDVSAYNTRISGAIKNFDPTLSMPAKDARKFDLFIQYGVAAAQEALKDSGLDLASIAKDRIGVAAGSGIGGLPKIEDCHRTLLEGGPRKVSPFFIPGTIINLLPGEISILNGLQGPNVSVVTACTTGAHNIIYAARSIMFDEADVMVAGGAEMATSPLGLGGFSACRALSTRNDEPTKASRPWDKDRDGFVLGDGAGMLILEEYEHAKRRGATIYAELVGLGASADGYHVTLPHPEGEGARLSMVKAMQEAKIDPSKIDYINAHGTSTPAGDEVEVAAIKRAFQDHAYKLAVSSTKSMTGHLLGAAGAVEAIISVLALRDQVAPPTINLDQPSESCDLDFVPHQARQMKLNYVLSNSFGFGGTNGSLIFKTLS